MEDFTGAENGIKTGTEDSAGTENGIKTGTEDSTDTENGIKTGIKAKALPYAEIEMIRILADQPTISIATLSNVMSLSLRQIRYMLDKSVEKST